jgi:hypothetical protein
MGMDVHGKNGKYFRANVWSWRPINLICDMVIDMEKLPLNTKNWSYNDGAGFETQEDCDILADALKPYVQNLKDDVFLCLGAWTDVSGKFLSIEESDALNEEFPKGTILYAAIVTKDGKLVEPAHSTNKKHLEEFIDFLKGCGGGFEIW